MSSTRTRKHYRVAVKKHGYAQENYYREECVQEKDILFTYTQWRRFMCISALFGLVIFLKGMLIGLLIKQSGDCNL